MTKFTLKEHEKRMREILNPPIPQDVGGLQPTPQDVGQTPVLKKLLEKVRGTKEPKVKV